MAFWSFLSEVYEGVKWAVAGLFGAGIASRFQKDELGSKIDFAIFAASGAVTAHYCTGAVATYFNIGPDNAGAVGFLLGAFGGSLIQTSIRGIKAADLWALIKERFGGR